MTAYSEARAELSRRFEEKRNRAERAADARREKLRADFPQFDAICAEKESYCEKILRAFSGSADEARKTLSELQESHRALREQEAEFLSSKGLGRDYLLPQYECALCSDKGYLKNGEMCTCLKKELNALRARESGLFSLFEKQTFENFKTQGLSGSMRENLAHCKAYAASFDPKQSANLLFVGGTGVGKTHLSSAIGRAALEKGYSVVYEGAMQALSVMETERFSEDKPQTRRFLECDLLILDDLGTELPGKVSVSFLYLIINSRLIAHLPTIVSTNLSDRELEGRYEQRLFSRLIGEYEVLLFDGEDRRGLE